VSGHWQNPAEILPDDEITVLVRLGDGEDPEITLAYRDADEWVEYGTELWLVRVTGWLHTDDARRILDGGAA
jgi:hypothetical protein